MRYQLLTCIATLMLPLLLVSQTPFSLINSSSKSEVIGALPANNPWLGAQVGYMFGNSEEFADNLLVSGRLLHHIIKGDSNQLNLPVMGNISAVIKDKSRFTTESDKIKSELRDILMQNQGVNIGLYPYFVLKDKDKITLTLHGAASWKLNASEDSISKEVNYLNQGRFSIGADFLIGSKRDGDAHPMSISIAPVISVFSPDEYLKSFGTKKSAIASLELNAVVPLGKGIGIMFEKIFSFTKDIPGLFNVGLVISSETN